MHREATLSAELTSKVLLIGPDYRNHRGGIGAVLEIYNKYFEEFKFIKSYKVGTGFYKILIFTSSIFRYVYVLISDRKIQIIHFHGSTEASFYRKFLLILLGKYIFRKKIIYHIHGGRFGLFYNKSGWLTKKMISFSLSHVDMVIALSQSWKDYFVKTFKIKDISVLPNIIDYPIIELESTAATNITLLFLGLICDAKGVFDLINVIGTHKQRYEQSLKLLIGGNGEVKKLHELIKKYDIGEMVEYLGWITKEEKVKVFNRADIYILPSYNEGLPISILEAMSYGKAIITTGVGGIPEIVKNNINGFLFNPGDKEKIMSSIDFFIENPEKIKMYGRASIQIAQQHLPEFVLNKLCIIYEKLLNASPE